MENLNQYLERKYPLLRSFSGRKSEDGKRDWPEWWQELPDAPRTGVLPVDLSIEALQQWASWEQESLADPVYALPREQGGVWFAFEAWRDSWARAAQVFARHLAERRNRPVWQVPDAHGCPDPVARARAVVESFLAWLIEAAPSTSPEPAGQIDWNELFQWAAETKDQPRDGDDILRRVNEIVFSSAQVDIKLRQLEDCFEIPLAVGAKHLAKLLRCDVSTIKKTPWWKERMRQRRGARAEAIRLNEEKLGADRRRGIRGECLAPEEDWE